MQRFEIREGWTTFILTAIVVWIAVLSIQAADWADGLGILNRIMLVGLIAGFIASKWRRIPSPALHLGGLVAGLLIVLWGMTSYLNDSVGGRREKLRWLWDRGERWLDQIIHGQSTEDLYLFIFFISILTYLMAYMTVWFVFRARWIWAALFFPGVVLLLNLGYSLRVPTGLVVFFIFTSLLLLMRFTLLQREINWRRFRIDYPDSLMWRGMWVATYLSLGIIIFGWAVPVSARSDQANDLWRDVDGPWRSVEDRFSQWFVGLRGPGSSGIGGFAAFSDSFDLGGPLSLSDKPVVYLTGPGAAPYLAAHRYNVYTGRGWESDVNDTYPAEGVAFESGSVSPQIELKPGESLPQDGQFNEQRQRESFTMEVQRPRGSLVFVPDSFVTADVATNLVVSWQLIDQTVDVNDLDMEDVPADVWPLVQMLQDADFTPPMPSVPPTATLNPEATESPEATATPTATPVLTPRILPHIELEISRLYDREIFANYTIDPSTWKADKLTFSGYFPVYSDVEAVRARNGLENGTTYTVESMVSSATSFQLQQAGEIYPDEITARYLDLPDTVTERTRQLAREITIDVDSTYDAAKALEQYLRQNVAYNERIEFPPSDVDVVDYVLFTSQEGYCEYYSSAFIVMARSLGIPSRMAVGFFPTDERDDNGYLYRELNAHAWPEIYFPSYGWIGFEPTAARSEVNRDPAAPGDATNNIGPEDRRGEGILGSELGEDLDQLFQEENLDLPTGAGAVNSDGNAVSSFSFLIRVIPLIVLLAILIVAYLWLRGTRGLTPSSQLYAKLSRGASWGGIRAERHMTPNEYADDVAKQIPGSRQPVGFLTELYVQETYSNRPVSQAQVLRARQAWQRLRGLLLKYFFARLRPWGSRQIESVDDDEW